MWNFLLAFVSKWCFLMMKFTLRNFVRLIFQLHSGCQQPSTQRAYQSKISLEMSIKKFVIKVPPRRTLCIMQRGEWKKKEVRNTSHIQSEMQIIHQTMRERWRRGEFAIQTWKCVHIWANGSPPTVDSGQLYSLCEPSPHRIPRTVVTAAENEIRDLGGWRTFFSAYTFSPSLFNFEIHFSLSTCILNLIYKLSLTKFSLSPIRRPSATLCVCLTGGRRKKVEKMKLSSVSHHHIQFIQRIYREVDEHEFVPSFSKCNQTFVSSPTFLFFLLPYPATEVGVITLTELHYTASFTGTVDSMWNDRKFYSPSAWKSSTGTFRLMESGPDSEYRSSH